MCPEFEHADQERQIKNDWLSGPNRNIDFGMSNFVTGKHKSGIMYIATILGDAQLANILGTQDESEKHIKLQEYLKLDTVKDKDWNLAYDELCMIEDSDLGEIVEIEEEPDEQSENPGEVPPPPTAPNGDSRRGVNLSDAFSDRCLDPNCDCEDTSRGVRGGLALPADEAEPAETPITSLSKAELKDLLEMVEGVNVLEQERSDTDILALLPRATLMTIALDSGACDHVANEEDLRGFKVHATEASKAGRGYIAANGERVPNQGECRVGLKDPNTGAAFDSLFNLAPVSRPLFSVGRICDNGAEVHFTATKATVSKAGRTLAVFERKDGLYVATVEVRGEADPASTFVRQGARS